MPPITCKSEVAKISNFTHDVREITFRLKEPADLPFTAGQYVNFMVPVEGKTKPASRLYSIASAPYEKGIIKIVYNYVGGPGTAFLHGLSVGSPVTFKAPFGHFVVRLDSVRDVLFVATGTGVIPFYSMINEYFGMGIADHLLKGRKVTLLWGIRHEKDLYWQEELRAIEKISPNFRLLLTLSRPEGEWTGLKGRVTAIFPEYYKSVENLEIYCCGGDAMIGEITALAKERGLCPVYREKYF